MGGTGPLPTWPSSPPTSAFATTWVMTAPKEFRPYSAAQSSLNANVSQVRTASSGPSSGAARTVNLATCSAAWHAAQRSPEYVGLVEDAMDEICVRACARRRELEARSGKG